MDEEETAEAAEIQLEEKAVPVRVFQHRRL
jgi:hypothetical protein